MKIMVLKKGSVFGFEDIINQRNYTFEVNCISDQGCLYEISAPEFFNKFSSDENSWNQIL